MKITDDVRERFKLNASWVSSIKRSIEDCNYVYIHGKGNLARDLHNHLSKKGFVISEDYEYAEALVILKKDVDIKENNRKIVNLTEKEYTQDEIKMKHLFTEPNNKIIYDIQEYIRDKVLQISQEELTFKKETHYP